MQDTIATILASPAKRGGFVRAVKILSSLLHTFVLRQSGHNLQIIDGPTEFVAAVCSQPQCPKTLRPNVNENGKWECYSKDSTSDFRFLPYLLSLSDLLALQNMSPLNSVKHCTSKA